MKPILFFLISLLLLSCGPNKFVPKHGMIQLTNSTKTLELKKRQQLYYQGKEHGSVGIDVKMSVENKDVIKITQKHEYHENPNWKNQDGGDRATITFVLTAMKAGTTSITIKNFYHGNLESERSINCTVVE